MIHIFIVNPYAGKKTFADDLRSKLEKIEDLNYFVFNTRYAGYEVEIVKLIQDTFAGEHIRYYCCGGSGTMRNIMNGFEDLSQVEIAWYPCGDTNDFMKKFGEDEILFHSIEALIDGEVLPVDYIQTNHGVAINSISIGLDAIALRKEQEYQILRTASDKFPLQLGIIYSLFLSKVVEYEVVLNNQLIIGPVSELFFGNGHVMGGNLHFFENSELQDGLGQYRVMEVSGLKAVPYVSALQKKRVDLLDNISKHGKSSFIRLRRKDGAPFAVNQDGDLVYEEEEWEAHIVQKGLNLIVPKGVRISGK